MLCRFESGSGHHLPQQEQQMRQPNPLDPLDGVKRWLAELWPVERAAVLVGIAAVAALLIMWAVR